MYREIGYKASALEDRMRDFRLRSIGCFLTKRAQVVILAAFLTTGVFQMEAQMQRDESTGLYFDPEVEVTLGTVDGRNHSGRVIDIHQGKLTLVLSDEIRGRVVIPLYQLNESAKEYFRSLRPPYDLRVGSFQMETPFEHQPIIEVFFQIPLENGEPATEAANLVYYAPYLNEKGFFESPHHQRIGRKHGLSLFSFQIKTNLRDLGPRETGFYFVESGWPAFIFQVQKRIMDELGLPYRKLLILGNSAGSTLAAHMAMHYPQWVEAVAFVGGGRFDKPPEAASEVKWFIALTAEDRSTVENEDLVAALQKIEAPVLYGLFPPIWSNRNQSVHFHHSPSEHTQFAQTDFLADIAAGRSATGQPGDPNTWNNELGSSPPALALEIVGEPPALTTWHNPLPGPRIAEWAEQRLLPLQLEALSDGGVQLPILMATPVSGKPRAIAIFIPNPKEGSPDPLHYLASQNVLAIGMDLSGQGEASGQAVMLARNKVQERFPDLPVYYLAEETMLKALDKVIGDPRDSDSGIIILTDKAVPTHEVDLNNLQLYSDRPVTVVDLREGAEDFRLESRHPFHETALERTQWIRIPGDGPAQDGERWVTTWQTVADLCR